MMYQAKYITLFSLALCIASNTHIHGLITQSARIEAINKYIDPSENILVLFDIDNTIATTCTSIGSDAWFTHEVKKYIDAGMTPEQALQIAVPLYVYIQNQVDLRLVEEETLALINTLQNNNINVMALTARSAPLVDRTQEQLAALGIDFSLANDFATDDIILGFPYAWVYCNGILFCNNYTKDVVLLEFLNTLELDELPEKIIFIDDKEHHVVHVEKALIDAGIECIGIHYTYMEQEVKNFDAAYAAAELSALLQRIAS